MPLLSLACSAFVKKMQYFLIFEDLYKQVEFDRKGIIIVAIRLICQIEM